jgi:tetratricopeptide (TPR) repeat protein
MEKNGFLGAFCKTVCLTGLLLMFASCSLPRIIILNDPLTPEEHVNLGVAYEKKGELDAALKEYNAASRNLPVAHLHMGNIYFQKKDFNGAEAAYKKAIEQSKDPRAYNNLAWLYYTTGAKLEEAEVLAQQATRLRPDSQEFADTLRRILDKRGQKTPNN